MKLTIFMDEAGRTGQQRYTNEKWNFRNQPYFGLGALYIPSDKVEHLREELEIVINKEHFQNEFKWDNKAARNRVERLFPILMDVIKHNGARIHFEIEDKRFSIAKVITDYCILPFYAMTYEMMSNPKTIYRKRAFASYITDYMSDELLWEICCFFDSNKLDTSELKNLIRKIISELNTKAIKEYCLNTIVSIEMFESGKLQLNLSNLFPIKDTIKHNGVETTLTIDPHTDCFSDLLNTARKYFPDCEEIDCIHDVQDQWKPALEESIDRLALYYNDDLFNLNTKSGYDIIINTVDYILGYLKSKLSKLFLNNMSLPKHLESLCESNLTLVASSSLQEKVFKNNPEIIVVNYLYDVIKSKEA